MALFSNFTSRESSQESHKFVKMISVTKIYSSLRSLNLVSIVLSRETLLSTLTIFVASVTSLLWRQKMGKWFRSWWRWCRSHSKWWERFWRSEIWFYWFSDTMRASAICVFALEDIKNALLSPFFIQSEQNPDSWIVPRTSKHLNLAR